MTCGSTATYIWRTIKSAWNDGGIIRVRVDAGNTVDGASFLPAFCDHPPDDQRQDENRQHEARELDYPHSIHRKPPSRPTDECRLAHNLSSFGGEAGLSGDLTDPAAQHEQDPSHG